MTAAGTVLVTGVVIAALLAVSERHQLPSEQVGPEEPVQLSWYFCHQTLASYGGIDWKCVLVYLAPAYFDHEAGVCVIFNQPGGLLQPTAHSANSSKLAVAQRIVLHV